MAAKLGSDDVSFRLGSTTPAAVYLGSEQVWSAATVPGAPTIDVASYEGETIVRFFPPENDGGSAITGYKFYFDDVEATPLSGPNAFGDDRLIVDFTSDFAGQSAQVSAVNALGESTKSAPVTVTVAE